VKLSGFGVFTVRDKAKRMGCNPKTGIEVLIEPRRAITFSPSHGLKDYVNDTTLSQSTKEKGRARSFNRGSRPVSPRIAPTVSL